MPESTKPKSPTKPAKEPAAPSHGEHQPGDAVTIYTDPLTCKEKEETATLVARIAASDGMLEHWFVRFATSPGQYRRAILSKGVKPVPAE